MRNRIGTGFARNSAADAYAALMAQDRIVVDPKVMVGKPVVRGTRIPVELLLRKLSEGASVHNLLEAYPGLSTEDILAAIAYAADTLAAETTVATGDGSGG